MLTGGAAGLAAAAGSALGLAQPAEAVTLPPSVVDWINVTNNPGLTKLAKGDGVTDDTAAIQGALNAASPGAVVYLPGPTLGSAVIGTYIIKKPLTVPPGVILSGCVPAGQLADKLTGMFGTILKVPASGWSAAGFNLPAVILLDGSLANNTTNTLFNPVVKDLWIDCSAVTLPPAGPAIHGIASFDNVNHAVIEHAGIAAPTGMGIYGSSVGAGRPDGWAIGNVIVELPFGDGVRYEGQDCFMSNVHVQNGNTNGSGDGFVITGGNNRLVGCRADSCRNGFTIDVRQAGKFSGSVTLAGCGTEENLQNGLNVINTDPSATAMNDPVLATGCSFDGDGVSGGTFAGISVTGANIVILTGCNVNVTAVVSNPSPPYALSLGKSPQNGSDPTLIQAIGGWWTAANAGTSVIHGSDAATVLSVGVHGFVGTHQFGHGDAVKAFTQTNQL
jgi:hypothetical protein